MIDEKQATNAQNLPPLTSSLSANILSRQGEQSMARGIIPRQPAKTGRHEGARRPASKVASPKQTRAAERRAKAAPAPKAGKPKAPKTKAKGYNPLAPERVQEIMKRLDERYPNVTCALHHRSAWELVVATILSAQSTDANVNRVTPELFAKYPTVQDFAALTPQQLEPDVRSTGFFRNKSKSVVGAAQTVVRDFGGQVPDEMDKLLTLPGVARKTANVVLGTWFGKNVGVVVDTHVTRIANRLELTTNTDPVKIEQDLMKVIPQERWTLFSHQIIWHGRTLCMARSPKCAECPLENLCHAPDKTWDTTSTPAD
jgi:endonuclease-3